MVALVWLVFAAIVGTGQAKFPQPGHLKQYITGRTLVTLNRLHIKTIPENAFGNHSNITELDLYSNEIRQINATAFSGLPNLSKLVLEANLLIVPPLLTFIRTSLTYLDMSQNNITYIPRFYFYGCSELKFLFLGSNKLSMMPNLEYVAGTIQIIGLSVNQIVDVKAFYGNQYSRLRRLDLNGNNLTKFCLPSRVFSPLLEAILLHENKLTTIQLPKDFHHTDLHLRDNPWHCDQFLSWVRQCSLARFHLKCPGYVALDLLTCKSPAKLKGMPAYLAFNGITEGIDHGCANAWRIKGEFTGPSQSNANPASVALAITLIVPTMTNN